MSEELHGKIKAFLSGEFVRGEGRQCVAVELMYAPGGGYKEEPLRKWVRADEPEWFEDLTKTEMLVTEIIDIANTEADSRPAGKHRYVVRTHQHLGGRQTMSFSASPAYNGGPDDMALVAAGGGGAGQPNVIAAHASQLMRVNAQMFDGTIRVLGHTNEQLRIENTELRSENHRLKRELDDARSAQLEREFSIAQQMERSQLKSAGIKQILQFGTILVAKMTGGADGGVAAGTALGQLVFKFGDSLQPDQVSTLMNVLDMSQKALFMEIIQMVAPKEDQGTATAPPPTAKSA